MNEVNNPENEKKIKQNTSTHYRKKMAKNSCVSNGTHA